jgi:hypothetical protein
VGGKQRDLPLLRNGRRHIHGGVRGNNSHGQPLRGGEHDPVLLCDDPFDNHEVYDYSKDNELNDTHHHDDKVRPLKRDSVLSPLLLILMGPTFSSSFPNLKTTAFHIPKVIFEKIKLLSIAIVYF